MSLMDTSSALINRFRRISAENIAARTLVRELKSRAEHLSEVMEQAAHDTPVDYATSDNLAIIMGGLTIQIHCIESALALNDIGTLVAGDILEQARKVVTDFDLVFARQLTSELS